MKNEFSEGKKNKKEGDQRGHMHTEVWYQGPKCEVILSLEDCLCHDDNDVDKIVIDSDGSNGKETTSNWAYTLSDYCERQ